MISCFTTSPLQCPVLPLGCGFKNHDAFRWYGVLLLLNNATEDARKWWRWWVLPPRPWKALVVQILHMLAVILFWLTMTSIHFYHHALLGFAIRELALILNFHLFDGWRHAIPRLSELSLCLTTYPNSGFFRWHRNQTRLRVRTLRSQLLMVDFIEKPFDRLLHASTVSTPSRI